MEILPKSKSEADLLIWKPVRNTSVLNSVEVLTEELEQIRKSLLLKSNKNVSRYTIVRNSLRLSDDQVKTVATLLPDEVMLHIDEKGIRKYDASVLFADVSGFTDLSEKYQTLENGASKLSMVLNFYLGTMVQEILSHGGDILKFAGDAFIATFRAENELTMQDAIQRAIDSALIIQKNCSNFQTDFANVRLNVKIAISGGEVYFSFIGDEEISAHYAVVGDPVWQVKNLQNNISPGEVLVTPKAWFYTTESLYLYQYNRDMRHYKVTGFKNSLEFVERQHEAILNFYEMKKKLDEDQNSASMTFNESSIDPFSEARVADNEMFSLRRSITGLLDNKSRKTLRRFIIKPVMNAIDLNEPIENLTEMRNVVIVFANFVISTKTSLDLIRSVDQIYKSLCLIVAGYEGTVNKVSLFDKDTMFLIVFGLRGLKHELEARKALRCASELLEAFKSLPEVSSVSLGVTAGVSYCGLVGHSLRREYSVLSVTVNKAARLMMAYPKIVSCDQVAMLKSKMDLKNFTILPKLNLKGLRGEVFAYEFKEVTDKKEIGFPKPHEHPLLGRNESLINFRMHLRAAILNFNQEARNLDLQYKKRSCFIIKGDTQQGKTRILDEIFVNCFNEGLKCIRISLSNKDLKIPFGVVSYILQKVLSVNSEIDIEGIVLEKFTGLNVDEYLFVLNPILKTNFTKSSEKMHLKLIFKLMFKILITQTFIDFWVIFIDDIEFMDKESFELLSEFLESNSIFLFLTLGYQQKLLAERKSLFDGNFVIFHRLKPIDFTFLSEIACHCLKVSAMSMELEKYLQSNSNGSPGWIETCVHTLLQEKKLLIVSMTMDQAIRSGNVIKEQISIETSAITFKQRNLFDSCCSLHNISPEDGNKIVKVAVLKNIQVHAEASMYERADHELMTYDSLTSYEQLVCKCGAVLGVEFKRHMLSYVLSSSTERMIGKAVMKLLELQIFACSSRRSNSKQQSIERATCHCENLQIFDSCRDLPDYASCSGIRFQREGFRDVVYNLLTEKQRLDFHRKALVYLHAQTRRCDSCGNRQFRELINEDLNFDFNDGVVNKKDTSFKDMIKCFDSINLPLKKSTHRFSKSEKFLSPVLNYLNFDFHNCKCEAILHKVYSEMLSHCVGPNLFMKLIDTKITLARKCIKMGNIPRANSLLRNALIKLNMNKLEEDSRIPDYFHGRILTLKGICSHRMMQREEALEFFYKSCKVYCVVFPKTFNWKAKLKLAKIISDIKSSLKREKIENCSRLFSLVTTQLSFTMNLMFDFFFENQQYDLAMLAAFWSLRKILKFDRTLSGITRSFGNALKIVFFTGKARDFIWLQEAALIQTARTSFMDNVDLEGLTWTIKMYHAIMLCQSANCNLRLAVKIGNISADLCSKVQMVTLETNVVPLMFLLLLTSQRDQEAFSLLGRFGMFMEIAKNMNGMIWYHALAMDLMLETSFTAVSFKDCDSYFLKNITNFFNDSTFEAQSRFFANMLLWSVRHKTYEFAQIWSENLLRSFSLNGEVSLNKTFTGLRLMEALTLQLVYAIDDRDSNLFEHFNEEIKKIEAQMFSAIKISKCFKERFELHRIHFNHVKSQNEKSFSKLQRLMKISRKNQNFNNFNLINHTQKVWRRSLPKSIESFWINHTTEEASLSLNQIILPEQIFPFSLPIPEPENLGNRSFLRRGPTDVSNQ